MVNLIQECKDKKAGGLLATMFDPLRLGEQLGWYKNDSWEQCIMTTPVAELDLGDRKTPLNQALIWMESENKWVKGIADSTNVLWLGEVKATQQVVGLANKDLANRIGKTNEDYTSFLRPETPLDGMLLLVPELLTVGEIETLGLRANAKISRAEARALKARAAEIRGSDSAYFRAEKERILCEESIHTVCGTEKQFADRALKRADEALETEYANAINLDESYYFNTDLIDPNAQIGDIGFIDDGALVDDVGQRIIQERLPPPEEILNPEPDVPLNNPEIIQERLPPPEDIVLEKGAPKSEEIIAESKEVIATEETEITTARNVKTDLDAELKEKLKIAREDEEKLTKAQKRNKTLRELQSTLAVSTLAYASIPAPGVEDKKEPQTTPGITLFPDTPEFSNAPEDWTAQYISDSEQFNWLLLLAALGIAYYIVSD